jgi:hypothetical protein
MRAHHQHLLWRSASSRKACLPPWHSVLRRTVVLRLQQAHGELLAVWHEPQVASATELSWILAWLHRELTVPFGELWREASLRDAPSEVPPVAATYMFWSFAQCVCIEPIDTYTSADLDAFECCFETLVGAERVHPLGTTAAVLHVCCGRVWPRRRRCWWVWAHRVHQLSGSIREALPAAIDGGHLLGDFCSYSGPVHDRIELMVHATSKHVVTFT